jgi:hypothetical protein
MTAPMRVIGYFCLALTVGMLSACKTPPGSGTTAYMENATSGGAQDFYPADAGWGDATVRRAEAAEEGATLFTDQASWNLPGANVSLNDAARMLAGLVARPRRAERRGPMVEMMIRPAIARRGSRLRWAAS